MLRSLGGVVQQVLKEELMAGGEVVVEEGREGVIEQEP